MVDVGRIALAASGLRFTALDTGPSDRSVVVCLHGFPDTPHTFRHQFAPLAEAGHRVIAPTLRGYEPSSQPADGDYTLMAMANDFAGWLDDLGVERAHLVGHDWGAAVAYVAAARHPDRISTATTMAVPPLARIPTALRRVPRQLQRSWYMTFFQLPWISERAVTAADWRLVRWLWRTWSPDHTLTDGDWDRLRAAFEQPGVVEAALAYYRQNATPPILLGVRSSPATEAIRIDVPMLIMHGTDDGCMDRRLFDHTIQPGDFGAGVRRVEVERAGHFLHLERPDEVNAALVDHIGNG